MPRTRSRSSCERGLGLLVRVRRRVHVPLGVVVEVLACRPEIHRQAHQPLLRAVVQVALDARRSASALPTAATRPALGRPSRASCGGALVGTEEPTTGGGVESAEHAR